LSSIYAYISEGCNLKCHHCYIAPKYTPDAKETLSLDPDLFDYVVEQGIELGLQNVKFTGGEPTLHPQFERLVETVKQHDIRFRMESNGLNITPGLAKILSKTKRPNISISLDASTSSIHDSVRGVEGSFQRALTGLKNLVEAGVSPQIIFTLMKKNQHQIADIISLAHEVGAGSLKFNIVQPSMRGEKMHKKNETLSIQELLAVGHQVTQVYAKKSKIPLVFSFPLAFQPLSHHFSGQSGVCGITTILGLLADGQYGLCGFGAFDDKVLFGNAKTTSLKEVWVDHPVLSDIFAGLPKKLEGICGQCLVNGLCQGSCLANNYHASGSLWSPHWFCDQAYKQGLFPVTRLKPEADAHLELQHSSLPGSRPSNALNDIIRGESLVK